MNWLDTETKGMLQKEAHTPSAPPKTADFALVIIRKGDDHGRIVRAIRRINNCDETAADTLAKRPLPIVVNSDLSEAEALLGQFELICCDTISPFIRSEILRDQRHPKYVPSLFARILASPEFAPTTIDVLHVPATEAGRQFLDQFLGISSHDQESDFLQTNVSVPFKKARIMKHWASRIGAQVRCADFDRAEH